MSESVEMLKLRLKWDKIRINRFEKEYAPTKQEVLKDLNMLTGAGENKV